MKVTELNRMIRPLLPILEHYKEWTVEAMLQDIYQRCCQNPEAAAEIKPTAAANMKVLPYRPDRKELFKILPELSPAELHQVVDSYNKEQIIDMARDSGMKNYSRFNKEPLVAAFCRFLHEKGEVVKDPGEQVQDDLPVQITENIRPQQEARSEKGAEEVIDPELKTAADKLPDLNPEERIKLLKTFSKAQIELIARYHKLRIPKYNSKNNTIRILANQLGFLEVHRNMRKRQ